MREDIHDNEIFMKVKQRAFKHALLLGMNCVQQEQLKDWELKSHGLSSSSSNFRTKSRNNIKISTHKEKNCVPKSCRASLLSWCHENLQYRGETRASKTVNRNFSWTGISTGIKTTVKICTLCQEHEVVGQKKHSKIPLMKELSNFGT